MRPLLFLTFCASLPLAQIASAQIQGLVDVHVHSDPDSVPRSLDGLDTARQGMPARIVFRRGAKKGEPDQISFEQTDAPL